MEKLFRATTTFFFIIALVIIISVYTISFIQFKKLLKASDWVDHTYQVIVTAQQVLEKVTYLESIKIESLLHEYQDYQAEYETTIKLLNSTILKISNLVADNSPQKDKVGEINTLILKRLQLLHKINNLTEDNKKNMTEVADYIDQNKVLVEQIRTKINDFIKEEHKLLQLRNYAVKQETRFNSLFLIFAQIISTAFLIFAFISVNRSRKEINSKEQQLRGIIEGAKDVIVVVDPKMRFLIFNTAFKNKFLRLFHKEVKVGMSLQEALTSSPEYKDSMINIWKESLSATEPYSKNIEFNIDGQILSYEINSSQLYDGNNHLIGAVHIVRNITERIKEQEELVKTNSQLQDTMKEITEKNEKITILLEMSDALLVGSTIDELTTVIAKYATEILDFSCGSIYLMYPSKNMLKAASSWKNPQSLIKQFSPEGCWSLRLGRIHTYIKKTDLVCEHAKENVCYMCVPLRAQNDIFGLLYIEFERSAYEKQLKNYKLIVGAFAEVTALALANVRLRENLRFQSLRDPLTSLYNRRYLEDYLTKQIAQSERTHDPISILMLDLDHFKRINDIHGHDAGDMVLQEVSKLLLTSIRTGDIAARFGGEEFIVVMYNTDLEVAYKRAEIIRADISSLLIKYGADILGKITISIGVSSYPQDGLDVKSLIEAADKALYVSKNTGRNKVVSSKDI